MPLGLDAVFDMLVSMYVCARHIQLVFGFETQRANFDFGVMCMRRAHVFDVNIKG